MPCIKRVPFLGGVHYVAPNGEIFTKLYPEGTTETEYDRNRTVEQANAESDFFLIHSEDEEL